VKTAVVARGIKIPLVVVLIIPRVFHAKGGLLFTCPGD
jgi:hypothetical protein